MNFSHKARVFVLKATLVAAFVFGFILVLLTGGCASFPGISPASPPGYEMDTTPDHDGEDYIGKKGKHKDAKVATTIRISDRSELSSLRTLRLGVSQFSEGAA